MAKEPLSVTLHDFMIDDETSGILTCTLGFRGERRKVQARVTFEPISEGKPRNGRHISQASYITVTGAGMFNDAIAEALSTDYFNTLAKTPATGDTKAALETLSRYDLKA